MKNTKDLKGLSDSELDDLIMHGINMQENSPRHGNDYQHYLNVVAAAKEEKALRGSSGGLAESGDAERIAQGVADNKVEDFSAPTQLHTAPAGSPVRGDESRGGQGEAPLGVVSDMARTTPENQNQSNPVTAGRVPDLEPEGRGGEQPRVRPGVSVGAAAGKVAKGASEGGKSAGRKK